MAQLPRHTTGWVLGRERLGSRRHQNLISVCFCRSIGILIFGRLCVAQSTDPIVIPGIIIALSHTELPKYATNLALKRPRIWIADGVACRISQRPLIGNTESGDPKCRFETPHNQCVYIKDRYSVMDWPGGSILSSGGSIVSFCIAN